MILFQLAGQRPLQKTFQKRFSLTCLLNFEKSNEVKIHELIQRGGTLLQVLLSAGLEGGVQKEQCSHM